jgi:hypothetical protein
MVRVRVRVRFRVRVRVRGQTLTTGMCAACNGVVQCMVASIREGTPGRYGFDAHAWPDFTPVQHRESKQQGKAATL